MVLPIRDKTLPTVIACLDTTLRRFGGAPTYGLVDYVPRHMIRLLFPSRLCGRSDREARPEVGVQHRPVETGHITRPP